MIPSVISTTPAPKPAASATTPTAVRNAASPVPEAERSSTGEPAAGTLRAETTKAVDAPKQTAVAPRLRDQERAEQAERQTPDLDSPTGPPPAFEESPLERQARTALNPVAPDGPTQDARGPDGIGLGTREPAASIAKSGEPEVAPPPTPRDRAEFSFSETRKIAEPRETLSLDVSA